ncbi:primosomal protein N' family DNA-binding protein [Leucobacter soli]|uniref:primosomal protein N' family DNA-binding protein n=1 Tax=Leucobacter soli TaxID=2812850 RepID=UPI00360704E9
MSGYSAERPGERRVAHVLLDSALPQLDHLFDYAVPEELAEELCAGQRVRVPFRSQRRHSHGYVIGFSAQSDFGGELQPIAEIVGPVPQLSPDVWRLARSVADRAGGSAGDILRLAIPQRMVRVEKQHLAAAIGDESGPDEGGPGEGEPDEAAPDEGAGAGPGTAPRAEFVPEQPECELAELLVDGGRLCITASHGPERLATGEWVGGWAVRLARAALAVFARGRSAIVVTPDYRDLEQLRDAFEALGHSDLIRVDARQSNAERYAGFLRALDPVPRVILGNRSAVYAPAHHLGAILMWDDGDPVLAEPLAPYVHARDAALVRAEQSGAGLYFAAHSRSAEVQRLVELDYVQAERFPPRRTRVTHADASIAPDAFAGRLPEFAARAIREGVREGRCSCRSRPPATPRSPSARTAGIWRAAGSAADRSASAPRAGADAAGAGSPRPPGPAASAAAPGWSSAAWDRSARSNSSNASSPERGSCSATASTRTSASIRGPRWSSRPVAPSPSPPADTGWSSCSTPSACWGSSPFAPARTASDGGRMRRRSPLRTGGWFWRRAVARSCAPSSPVGRRTGCGASCGIGRRCAIRRWCGWRARPEGPPRWTAR